MNHRPYSPTQNEFVVFSFSSDKLASDTRKAPKLIRLERFLLLLSFNKRFDGILSRQS
jgi:hypothetical protein